MNRMRSVKAERKKREYLQVSPVEVSRKYFPGITECLKGLFSDS